MPKVGNKIIIYYFPRMMRSFIPTPGPPTRKISYLRCQQKFEPSKHLLCPSPSFSLISVADCKINDAVFINADADYTINGAVSKIYAVFLRFIFHRQNKLCPGNKQTAPYRDTKKKESFRILFEKKRQNACRNKKKHYLCNAFLKKNAQMAELVDALVSNTSGFTSMPVRSRLWVQKIPIID